MSDVNIGESANDGTGDPLRDAFAKVNETNRTNSTDIGSLKSSVGINTLTLNDLAGTAAQRDLNLYTNPISIAINPNDEGAAVSNVPAGATGESASVQVFKHGFETTQVFYFADGQKWERTYAAGDWGAWKPMGAITVNITSNTGVADRDANTWVLGNAAYIITSALISNTPPEGAARSNVTAMVGVTTTGNRIEQTWYEGDSIFNRVSVDGGQNWSEYKETLSDEWVVNNISLLSAGQRNFDSHKDTGVIYTLDGSSVVSNGPQGGATYLGQFVNEEISNDITKQTYWNDESKLQPYTRIFIVSDNTWTPWVRTNHGNIGALGEEHIVAFGDSIMYGTGSTEASEKSMLAVAQARLGYTADNLAIGASQMSPFNTNKPDENFSEFAVSKSVEIAAASIIFIFYGVNDHNRDVPLGTLASSDEQTFYGAMEVGYSAIFNTNPQARVVFGTPLRGSNPSDLNQLGLTVEDYADAIRAFCQKYALQVVDLGRNVGINEKTAATLTTDGLHPNDDGYVLMGKYLGTQL